MPQLRASCSDIVCLPGPSGEMPSRVDVRAPVGGGRSAAGRLSDSRPWFIRRPSRKKLKHSSAARSASGQARENRRSAFWSILLHPCSKRTVSFTVSRTPAADRAGVGRFAGR